MLSPCMALPSQKLFEQAVQTAAPAARSLGLSLRTDSLWPVLLRQRVPMMAVRQGSTCHIGYSAYTPGQDFRALFPDLTPPQARLWMEGLVHHELTHCASALLSLAPAPSVAARAEPASRTRHAHQQESLADLGFAVHVAQADPQGLMLVARLMQLREERAAQDPVHDSSAALRCFLAGQGHDASPARAEALDQPPSSPHWLQGLRAWAQRCLQDDANPS